VPEAICILGCRLIGEVAGKNGNFKNKNKNFLI
jgi:hypothetical protein